MKLLFNFKTGKTSSNNMTSKSTVFYPFKNWSIWHVEETSLFCSVACFCLLSCYLSDVLNVYFSEIFMLSLQCYLFCENFIRFVWNSPQYESTADKKLVMLRSDFLLFTSSAVLSCNVMRNWYLKWVLFYICLSEGWASWPSCFQTDQKLLTIHCPGFGRV